MPPLLELFLAWLLCTVLHVSCMALAARRLGFAVREVSYGFGPQLYARGLLRIRLLPVGGYVKLVDSTDPELSEEVRAMPGAFDRQPRWKRFLLALSGPAGLLLAALSIRGGAAWHSFAAGFEQVLRGALGPFSTAQDYLADLVPFVAQQSFAAVFALLAAKLAAFNLLPLPLLNGGEALRALLTAPGGSGDWYRGLALVSVWVLLVLWCGWLLALGYWFFHSS